MTWKTDPRGIALAAVIRPPCDWTIDRQIDSPIPIPSVFVVKKASKIRFSSSGLMPVPESSTDMRTQSELCFSVRTHTQALLVRVGCRSLGSVHKQIEHHLL